MTFGEGAFASGVATDTDAVADAGVCDVSAFGATELDDATAASVTDGSAFSGWPTLRASSFSGWSSALGEGSVLATDGCAAREGSRADIPATSGEGSVFAVALGVPESGRDATVFARSTRGGCADIDKSGTDTDAGIPAAGTVRGCVVTGGGNPNAVAVRLWVFKVPLGSPGGRSADASTPGKVDERSVFGGDTEVAAAAPGTSLQPSSVSARSSLTVAGGKLEGRGIESGLTDNGGTEGGGIEDSTHDGGTSLHPASVSASSSSTVAGGKLEGLGPTDVGAMDFEGATLDPVSRGGGGADTGPTSSERATTAELSRAPEAAGGASPIATPSDNCVPVGASADVSGPLGSGAATAFFAFLGERLLRGELERFAIGRGLYHSACTPSAGRSVERFG